ncbi:hypothetical protein MJO28_005057 [Puccinia striiformis f. sp. tritici]|uniref:Uncharacterized protein n=1 Tax=Puccinia striiformis f. sp. tritici TaxID=168172 RepID=A0ACC0EKV5_9BASI|nr:hypothetical protein MJO28_005057 [Puccinia striiformis f. sp. tritici]
MGTPQELSKIQKADIPNTNAREISRIHRMVHSTNKARGIGSTARNSAKRVMCNTELYGACSTTKGGDPRTGPPRHPGRNLRQYLVAAQVAREAAGGVLDSHFGVYGAKNLRVVDASAFPSLPPGHPQSTVYMIAERAAALIKQEYS